MRAAQKILFGTELPRGHGHKGKLSTKMSALYDELTGRQPRKRKSKTSAQMLFLLIPLDSIQTSKRPNLRPQSILVGVIGRGDYAKLIIERLLLQHHQVITVNQDTYANVCSYSFISRSPAQRHLLLPAFRIDPREQSSAANESCRLLQCLRHHLRGGAVSCRL